MTIPRACPDPMTLALFAHGRLHGAARKEVERHLADCPECPFVIAETIRFLHSEAEKDEAERAPLLPPRWWLVAAVAALCASALVWQVVANRDALRRVKGLAAKSAVRPVEGRLVDFDYTPFSNIRSDSSIDPDIRYRAEAEELAESGRMDPRAAHAQGVALLLAGESATAVEILSAAAQADPQNETVWNDLSVAYIALATVGDIRHFQSALTAADRARSLAPTMPSAHFNRGIALQYLGQRDAALREYRTCSALEPGSPWADEAKRRAALLHK